ncbi:MAG: UDP-GlcNAc:undecaprenyl-phosphate GlcNAc-1-phosphate transferase [Phycisphaerales bacterium]
MSHEIEYDLSMTLIVLSLLPLSLLLSAVMCGVVRTISLRRGAVDSAPVEGQTKMAHRRIPNTGGIGIYLAIALPIVAALGLVGLASPESLPGFAQPVAEHLEGVRTEMGLGLGLLGSITLLHVLGLIDDRRPMGAWGKLTIMVIPAVIVAWPMDTRLLTLLDAPAHGPWLSMLVTVLWIVVVTNAMNFIDNMDGYSAGVAAIAGGGFLAATLLQEQWFVAGVLALLVGGCLGFLLWNFPPAKLFMGDGGSLVVGFLLAFLTIRTTYAAPSAGGDPFESGQWYTLLMPVVVLAIPLYDFVSVTLIRLAQGKSPFKGDLQHFSHRLVQRGLSVRGTMVVIYGFTAVTAIAGVLLARADSVQAVLLGVLVLVLLTVIAVLEYGSTPSGGAPSGAGPDA